MKQGLKVNKTAWPKDLSTGGDEELLESGYKSGQADKTEKTEGL
jgi:hypothetical protein